jgi:uncharacterized protein YkwD
MARVRMLAWLALLPAASLALTADTAGATSPTRAMVHKINQFRAAHGVPRLRVSGQLRSSAQAYSSRLMVRGVFSHAGRIQANDRRFPLLGEILEIHLDRQARASLAFRTWRRSPSHRAAMLDRRFRWVGAGRTAGTFRGRPATIWVVHFGRR